MDLLNADLDERLDALMFRDRRRIGRELARARRRGQAADIARIGRQIELAAALRLRRAASVPDVRYPESLPVSARRDEVLSAIAENQVVVIAGETGSGKTTQIPKMCLELGRGVDGMIGHTQPRRIAARTVAERIAEELGVQLGEAVGYAVRFTDEVRDSTLVKVMTDGILLAELRRDRLLTAYDTIIVDEAHERSLNIDFLIGYLSQLLPQRPELKVIITSATIDTERFAKHFDAPVVEVSGRTFPVELRYRPVREGEGDRDRDLNEAIVDAVRELSSDQPGDILVFLPGERDIRDAADALTNGGPEGLEILPLYARLTAAEQHRAFRPHPGRRVVLATNIAETSLTVPGIRSVIDTGLARISRYSHRTKIQRLPIEPISKASANQRAGRCGRVAPGVCIRLYEEADFAGRPEFTDPEILRTNLASVILQMAAIGLGDIESFPFLEPPEVRSIADGRALLEELGAFERRGPTHRLTTVGRTLAQLPVDPRLGRMVLAARELDCVREVTIIAAALSIGDPRERPADKAQAADELHRRFLVRDSDFMGFIQLWDYLADLQSELSGNQFRRRCRAEYLNVLRIREWQDVAGQIRQVLRANGIRQNPEPAPANFIHQALLTGLLSQVGMRDRVHNDYLGARNARWQIGRGSALSASKPAWVMAGALVETERTWARTAARIEPAWVERAGAHLTRHSYSEPWWEPSRAEAMANERVTLYGLPVVAARRVSYSNVDPVVARDLFIRHALVDGDWRAGHTFLERNRRRVERVRSLEARLRQRDVYVGDEALVTFYDQALPDDVTNGRRFDRWWKRRSRTEPELLDIPFAALLDPDARAIDLSAYPTRWAVRGRELAVRYRWEHGAVDDGVTVEVPLGALNDLPAAPFSWNVPGYRSELVAALVRSLPKALRREFLPVASTVEAVLPIIGPDHGSLRVVLADRLSRIGGVQVEPGDFDLERVPPHLRVHFAIVDDAGRVLARGDDLDELRRRLAPSIRSLIGAIAPELLATGATSWSFGELPRRVERSGVTGYPALVDEGESVGVVVLDSPAAQESSTWAGVRRLLLLATPLPRGHVERRLTNEAKLALARTAVKVPALIEASVRAVADEIIARHGGAPFSESAFRPIEEDGRANLAESVAQRVSMMARALGEASRVKAKAEALAAHGDARLSPALRDLVGQLGWLADPETIASVSASRSSDLFRYLAATERRIDALPGDLRRDQERQAVVERVTERYARWRARRAGRAESPRLTDEEIDPRWMIEELRVSLWAQNLGTAVAVSEARLSRLFDEA